MPGDARTVDELLDQAERLGARTITSVRSDLEGRPLSAVIVISGQPETGELIAAFTAVEAMWEQRADEAEATRYGADDDG
jgi:hypothetical protein